MSLYHVGQDVTWNGIDAIVVAVGGTGWGRMLDEPDDEATREAEPSPNSGRIAIGLRIRDQDPPRDGYLDEETEELVKHADVGDWLPLWVNASALRARRTRRAAA